MFGWDFNKRRDRMKLFFLILCIFMVMGYSIMYVSGLINSRGHHAHAAAQHQHTAPKVHAQETSMPPKETDHQSSESKPYSTRDKEKAKKVAISFAKSFYTYDSDHPLRYLKRSKPYMADFLYSRLMDYPRRQTLDRVKTEALSTDVTPVADQGNYSIRWNVIVHGRAMSAKGKKHKEDNWYLVTLKNIKGSWKVTGVEVNVPD